jgi:hypothetical protein
MAKKDFGLFTIKNIREQFIVWPVEGIKGNVVLLHIMRASRKRSVDSFNLNLRTRGKRSNSQPGRFTARRKNSLHRV